MAVRAKFKYTGYQSQLIKLNERQPDGSYPDVEMRSLEFAPVHGNGDPAHENTKFWKLTPSGTIKLGTISPDAWAQFELGKEYYIDFTRAEP